MKTLLLAAFLPFVASAGTADAPASVDLLNHEIRPLTEKQPINLKDTYQGQVLLVVNTASKCGFTKQYDGLEKMYADKKDQGFAVLGFPSNDFMGQEPGTEEEIAEFCRLTYGVQFPMFEKVDVKKKNAHPFFKQLAEQPDSDYPSWNFNKYLIGRDGKLIAHFGSRTKPDDKKLVAAIDAAIAVPQAKESSEASE